MKKTINVNIGGYAFHIEDDAYASLEEYLTALEKGYENDPNKNEIMTDIENRLGEILAEQKGGSEVIDMRMVNLAKERIGNPEDLDETETAAGTATGSASKASKSKKKHLYRDTDHNTFGGVCAGLGHYFDIDAAWIKLIFTVLAVGGMFFWDGEIMGITLLAYLILWLCLPAAKTVEQKCEMVGQPLKYTEYKDYTPARPSGNNGSFATRLLSTIAGILLMMMGGSMLATSVAFPFGTHIAGVTEFRTSFYSNDDLPAKYANIIYNDLFCNSIFWWLVFGSVFFLSLLMFYEGIILCFKIKRPNWHPGLALLLLWIICTVALIIYSVYQFNPITFFS